MLRTGVEKLQFVGFNGKETSISYTSFNVAF